MYNKYTKLQKHMETILTSIDSGRANPDKVIRALVIAVKMICEYQSEDTHYVPPPHNPNLGGDDYDFSKELFDLFGKSKYNQ